MDNSDDMKEEPMQDIDDNMKKQARKNLKRNMIRMKKILNLKRNLKGQIMLKSWMISSQIKKEKLKENVIVKK